MSTVGPLAGRMEEVPCPGCPIIHKRPAGSSTVCSCGVKIAPTVAATREGA